LSRKENWEGIGKMRMMEKCMGLGRTRTCKCSIPYEKRMHKAKRLYRIIESLGYKALGTTN